MVRRATKILVSKMLSHLSSISERLPFPLTSKQPILYPDEDDYDDEKDDGIDDSAQFKDLASSRLMG